MSLFDFIVRSFISINSLLLLPNNETLTQSSAGDQSRWGMELIGVETINMSGGMQTGIAYNIFLPQERPSDPPAILVWERSSQPQWNPTEFRVAKWIYGEQEMRPFLAGGAREREAHFVFIPRFLNWNERTFVQLINLSVPSRNKQAYFTSIFQFGTSSMLFAEHELSQLSFFQPVPHPAAPGAHQLLVRPFHDNVARFNVSTMGNHLIPAAPPPNNLEFPVFRQQQVREAENNGRRFRETDAFSFVMANSMSSAKIINFEYPTNVMDQLRNQSIEVPLAASQTFINRSGATITETFRASQEKSATFSYGFTQSMRLFYQIEGKFGLPLIFSGTITQGGEINLGANQQWTMTETERFEVSREIIVPPHTGVQVTSYINWINNMQIEFKATMEIEMKVTRVSTDYMDTVLEDAPPAAVEEYLRHFATDLRIVGRDGNKIIVETFGIITGQNGLDTFTITSPIPLRF